MQTAHIPSLRWEEMHSPARKFHSFVQNISLALGGIRNGGTWCGGHPFDLQIRRIPAGAAVCPFHSHLVQWELFIVQSGTGVVRAGDETHAVKRGDVFIHPPGEPHQLINRGTADLEVLIIADNPELDAFYYPDSHKWGLRPPGKYFRMQEVGYFEGEEPAVAGAPPYQSSGSPPVPARTPFTQRKLHLDDPPWEEWHSEKGKFRGRSKELSIVLAAARDTPTGLGGHPFDLELNRLAPGECACPFHSHAAQWELFLILEGRADVRVEGTKHTVSARDVILHPPGEPHQITNSGSTDLVFFLVADNPPVDYCYYPDSDKWTHRSPRKTFRAIDVNIWEGEE
jgi:uncharacterized cupin superfamily protein